MNELDNKKISFTRLFKWLLTLMLYSYGLNILISYHFSINNAHTTVTLVLIITTLLYLVKKEKMVVNILFVNVLLYLITLIIGLSSKDFDVVNILRTFNYRLIFPTVFLLLFSLDFNKTTKLKMGLSVIKIINLLALIFSIFAIIEIYNPAFVYNLYANLTSHLTLILNGGISVRLISIVGNSINLGFYLVLGLGSALTLLFLDGKKSKIFSLYQLFLIVLFLYVIFYTYSRGAMMLAFIMIVSILLLSFKEKGVLNKLMVIFLFIILFYVIMYLLYSSDALSSRITTINLQSFISNTRFKNAYDAFNKDTTIFQYIFGHGITRISESYSFVFEFGYASLMYESGIIGFISVIGAFVIGLIRGLKNLKYLKAGQKDIVIFYIALIISGMVGLLVEDLYMQQPYSIYLWFSTMFLVSLQYNIKVENK